MNIYFSFLPRSLHRISGIFPLFLVVLILSMNSWAVTLKSPKPLMRFPDIHGERIVFVYGEDIWTAPSNGGIATRLTIHDGEERFPKFSPDGKLIAFTGEYDGNSDVYVMTVFGGDITRVTFHPGTDEVIGWHPIKKKIIFSSRRHSYNWFSRLFLISPDGTGLEELILHEAVAGSFSSDGTQIAFNKVSRENRTWKRYRGGTAQEVYLYDFKTNKEKNLTNFRGTDRIPMWIGDKIYFSSDRDRILNIYSYHTRSGKIEKLTHHSNYDVRRPSKGENKIVYELAGSIWILDIKTKISKKVPVEIRTDAPELRPHIKKVSKYITGFDCSPSGKRALIVARGEIFSAPRKEGPIRNLTKDSGSRDKDAVWSPDGKTIAYISDRDGENEIYLIDSMGKNRSKKLTRHTNGYRHTLRWSPDSKKIAFADHTLSCYYLDIQTKNVIKIDKAEYENVDLALDAKPIYDFSWSPDSRFVAYSKMGEDLVTKIYIYSLETGQTRCVSHGIFNDFNPVFSQDGKYLFFISNRRFNPTYCDFEWEMVYKNVAGIYSLTLRKHEKSFLPFKSDEEEKKAVKKSSDKGKKGKAKYKKKAEKMVRIDFKGLSDRIEALPLKPGNYRNLAVSESSIFYLNADKGDFNRFEFRSLGPRDLCAYSFKKQKQK